MINTLSIKSARRPLRNLFLTVVGTAALTLASSASAGAPDDVIAYFLGNGDLNAGKATLKANANQQSTAWQQQLYAATVSALTETTGTLGTGANSLRLKTTPSAVATYTLKLLPNYSEGLANSGVQAGLLSNASGPSGLWKLKDASAALKDAQKTADQSIALGLKSYPKGTKNTPFTGVTVGQAPNVAAAIAYQVISGARVAGYVGTGTTASATATVVGELTLSLVKKASTFGKLNPITGASTVTGLVAQYAGTQAVDLNVVTAAIVNGAVRGNKKAYLAIINAAAYGLAGTYLATGGTAGADAFDIADLVTNFTAAVTLNTGIKNTSQFLADVRNAIVLGIGAGVGGSNLATLGAGGISNGLTPSGFFAYNNGAPMPVTPIQ